MLPGKRPISTTGDRPVRLHLVALVKHTRTSVQPRLRPLRELEPCPDVHVHHDADDLEDLLGVEVPRDLVVEPLERLVSIRVGGPG